MRRVLVVGLDGYDPVRAERLMAAGRLPALADLRRRGGYARVRTTAPAQTPVAWSTVAVGANPGGHGIFDFLRRDPARYRPEVALHSYEQRSSFLPPRAVNRRRGTPLWQLLGDAGVPSAILRHPCTYPPGPVRGRMIAGVGVPDLRGGFGTGTVYSSDESLEPGEGERIETLRAGSDGRLRARLVGPPRPGGGDADLEMIVEPGPVREDSARIRLPGAEPLDVAAGRWSDWAGVKFRLGALHSVRGMVRFFLARGGPDPLLWASPVNLDPRAPLFPISEPWDYAGELADTLGPYHTLGMAEDHVGLDNGRLDEEAFLDQCRSVFDERTAMLRYELDRFHEGLLFCVVDTPDRLQHMFWRFDDPGHPANEPHGFDPRWADVIDEHYGECDAIVGEALEHADDDTLVLVLSDHGFTDFRTQLHLNAWLREQGLLRLRPGSGPAPGEPVALAHAVDWERTRAYAMGMGGVFLNIRDREARGTVAPGEAAALAGDIAGALVRWTDISTGDPVIRRACPAHEVYRGPWTADAPDVVVGTAPGYRISSATALGSLPDRALEPNRRRWSGDHVVDPDAVPGVLFANRPFDGSGPCLEDVAPTILHALGVPSGPAMEGRSLLP